ncbi:hypothetical protein FBY31_3949 [Arthrobacter sp. SLBN-100]|uniref:hypothetical protein n=1 Tax=Arthrobacter sp. SLBN-100 TaxID=2768450 RepID=UPI00115446B6|nr:hypothetical protein [Arthrobacter sp. SLBN-100]TQJ69777.1 hypothetical protein FBY31_3949 [Arthrobacter sp. SLBN-100]
MLHFPSTNSAAHRPSARDVARLGELLDDDVWAFSNCRVDAPGRPVAEVDWFFYNARRGTIMVSEWKGFPQRVVSATDTGTRWLLEGGLMVANPLEQVSKQLDSVRAVLRAGILPQHFPGFDPQELRLMQSVYSPQVDERTAIERIRWGKVYGGLRELAAVISNSASPAPLLLPGHGARLDLANALCGLFRTTCLPHVKAHLGAPQNDAGIDVARRISEIHRQIAALHGELADLTELAASSNGHPAEANQPAHTQPPITKPAPPKATGRTTAAMTEHQRMQAHVSRSFLGVNGSADAAAKALQQAWAAVVSDPQLNGKAGISVTLFGSVGTPLIKEKHGSLSKVLGMQLRQWCILQAEAAGMKPSDVPGKPSNIRVR